MTLALCYHAVSPTWPADLSVTPERFSEQVEEILGRGYEAVTFSELVAGGGGKRVAFTFDDSYTSVLELALPILEERGAVATVFVPTRYVGTGEPMSWPGIDQWIGTEHEHELMPMDWEQLEQLATKGWEIGSHTVSHPHLTELTPNEMAGELVEAKAAIEENLGRSCPAIAYPYGDHDDAILAVAEAAGYTAGATLPKRFPAARPIRWPRVGVYHGDDSRRFAMKVSPAMLLARRTPLWSLIGG